MGIPIFAAGMAPFLLVCAWLWALRGQQGVPAWRNTVGTSALAISSLAAIAQLAFVCSAIGVLHKDVTSQTLMLAGVLSVAGIAAALLGSDRRRIAGLFASLYVLLTFTLTLATGGH
jgi:hypothetical protein